MIHCKTAEFTSEEIRQAVNIQIRELPDGFLSSLGEEPLALLFTHVAMNRWGILVLAIESEKQQVVGYVFGTTSTGKLYADFLLKRTLAAFVLFLPKLLSWRRIKKAFETLLYPIKKQPEKEVTPKAELLDLAVTSAYHGKGIAQKLFNEFVEQFRDLGVTAFRIPTSEKLERAHGFYEKMGARKVSAIEVHDGERSFIYQYDIL